MRLFLVRHGQSTWNDAHRIQGQLDPPLSELGQEQAWRLAERLRGRAFDGFYTSDLKRASATAARLAAFATTVPTSIVTPRDERTISLNASA